MTESNIFFLDPSEEPTARISQLYPHLELFSDGAPTQNTLFVLGRPATGASANPQLDRLLLIDPPVDARQRFGLEGDVAVFFTGVPVKMDLPQVQTQEGGVAHIRIGDHFLDIYSQAESSIVHLPALGILCGGEFGSDVMLPRIAGGSDGRAEVETLRLLATLLKRQHFELFVPQYGSSDDDKVAVMKRLAADVAYLNSLQRTMGDGLARNDAIETIETECHSMLPATRNSPFCQAAHEANVATMMAAIGD